jgi:hypothetical protein
MNETQEHIYREYLIGEGERKGLYIKNGYIKQRILKKGEGNFANIDLWIMHKTIFKKK